MVVPTIGRTQLLGRCLRSVLACEPAPDEVVVVDQSGADETADLVSSLGSVASRVRVLPDAGRGIARATNRGVAGCDSEMVLVTHDDCTVDADWVGNAIRLLRDRPDALFTGRVLPPADATYVPSTITATERREYTQPITSGVLYPANMAFTRDHMLSFGGFDERAALRLAAEDNDLCFRWLASGRAIVYEPALVVWHHDWRTPAELRHTHVVYARAQGAFYAKHLMARDGRIVPLLRWDLGKGLRSSLLGTLRRTPRWQDPYREMFWSLIAGMASEMRKSRRKAV